MSALRTTSKHITLYQRRIHVGPTDASRTLKQRWLSLHNEMYLVDHSDGLV